MEHKSEVIVITSGKGGVGKTTTSAAIGAALAMQGKRVCVIDFDVGLRNLDLILGCEKRVVFDLIHLIKNECRIEQALIKANKINENLFMIAASQVRDKDALDKEGVVKVIDELRNRFDFIICDSPAGIEHGAKMAMYCADRAIVVTNPEVSSVSDSDRIIGYLDTSVKRMVEDGVNIEKHLLITRYDQKRARDGDMLSESDINDILGLPLIGIIPESKDVLISSNNGLPVSTNEKSIAGLAYINVAKRLCGESIDIYQGLEEVGFLKRLFRGIAR